MGRRAQNSRVSTNPTAHIKRITKKESMKTRHLKNKKGQIKFKARVIAYSTFHSLLLPVREVYAK
jgi:hypothetical protein